jgi:nucleoside-diphosphate-sugar epimerase
MAGYHEIILGKELIFMTTVLVTGGTGYIGSHTCVSLIEAGYDVIVLDNLYNSNEAVLGRIQQITGTRPKFYRTDILDRQGLDRIFEENKIVIHADTLHFFTGKPHAKLMISDHAISYEYKNTAYSLRVENAEISECENGIEIIPKEFCELRPTRENQ